MEIRTKQIKPDCFGESYSGHILVKRMKLDELEIAREQLGLLDIDVKKERTTKEDYEFMRNVYKMAKEYVISAEVVRVADGEKLDLEGLEYETELVTLHSEIASMFLNGWAMGNGKGQQQG